jgi:putative acetyltransferase
VKPSSSSSSPAAEAVIRRARRSEAPRLLEVWESAVRATHDFLSDADIAFYRRVIRDNFLPTAEVYVWTGESGRADGFMGLHEHRIEALFVHAGCRGRGVGRALVEHARALRGALEVDVNEQNAQAAGFYAAMGFRQVGRSPLDHEGRPFPLLHLRRD